MRGSRGHKLVAIIWDDAHDYKAGEWIPLKSTKSGMRALTVGLLVGTTKRYYVVAHTLTEDGSVRGTFNIPRSAVRSIRRLRVR